MAENEPNFARTLEDERSRIAKLQKELEEAQFKVNQNEAFGKYDITVPNEGELTYEQYLENRPTAPAEGLVRDGYDIVDAQTGEVVQEVEPGNFSRAFSYHEQNGEAQDYYNKGLENTGEYQAPKYEEMGLMQLAKEAAKARQLGDKATELEIIDAAEQYLTASALDYKDDAESAESAQKRYDEDKARFESLVDRIINRSNTGAKHSENLHDTVHNVDSTSEDEAEATADKSVATEEEPVAIEEESTSDNSNDNEAEHKPEVTKSESDQPENEQGESIKENDLSDSSETLHVSESIDTDNIDQDENNQNPEASEKKVKFFGVLEGKKPNLDVQPQPDTRSEGDIADDAWYNSNKEINTNSTDTETSVEKSDEKPKKWWQKVGESIRTRGGDAYWSALWLTYVQTPISEKINSVLDIGVKESMSPEERDQKRKRNRYATIAAGVGVAIVGTVIGVQLHNELSGNGDVISQLNDLFSQQNNTENPLIGGYNNQSGVGEGIGIGLGGAGIGESTTTQEVGGAVNNANIAISVEPGQGGIDLFKELNLSSDEWYDNAKTLVNKFPQDFYLENGDVRIAHSGKLSQGAQDFINSLRQGK